MQQEYHPCGSDDKHGRRTSGWEMECMVGWVWRTTLEEEGAVVVRRECRSLGSREGGRAPSLESDGDAKDAQGELKIRRQQVADVSSQ